MGAHATAKTTQAAAPRGHRSRHRRPPPRSGHSRRLLLHAFQSARPSCGAAACTAHDVSQAGPNWEHDAVAKVLIIGASRGIGLETVKAGLDAGHSVRALARSARRIRLEHPKLESRSGSRWPAFVNSITSLATAVAAGSLRSPNRRMHVHLR